MSNIATQKAAAPPASEPYNINVSGMPAGLAVLFDDRLYERVKQVAFLMSKAEGLTPPHLIGKSEACFSVVTRAITWKLDPNSVAASTYSTPGGRVGFEGKLVQAILENSGKLHGNVKYELIGDWSNINGNFEIRKSEKGKEFAVPKWTRVDARKGGCGVIVSANVRGEAEPRTLTFMLETCFPLNSTLWATRPDQQIKYTACRAFANTVAPGIMMGVPFDNDVAAGVSGEAIRDITPDRPDRSDFKEMSIDTTTVSAIADQADTVETVDPETGEIIEEAGSQIDPLSAAFIRGEDDFIANIALFNDPPEYNGDESLINSRRNGWREAERIAKERAS